MLEDPLSLISNLPSTAFGVSAAGLKVKGEEEAKRDDKLRAEIWNARSVIDKGYLSLLTLLELQRLVTDNRVHDFKRARLMQNDVAQNIELLEGAFGVEKEKVEKVKDGAEAANINVMNVTVAKRTLNEFVLKAVLTHLKGFQLLARATETRILPHPSAILVLPVALAFTLTPRGPRT